ncbi:hypothetical protein I6U48_28770 [Clostridium sp. PL3]|uniref:Uncharacterized protein n=1 Tax=Clostridium thailandense TaxID=2794346 RepID=A0A949U040_9CLOT|nr:hypothetical protein [Clostridium thailandense]MBV7276866.1 hypothetical protein [Clostridium thailandense]
MNISLSMLIEKLEHHKPQTYITRQEPIYIKAIKQISKNQTLFESSILYMSKASLLPQTDIYSDPINLLCISDTPLPSQYLESSNFNLIVLENCNDFFQKINFRKGIFNLI